MRLWLLSVLQCPKCGGTNLRLNPTKWDNIRNVLRPYLEGCNQIKDKKLRRECLKCQLEVKEGTIECLNCNKTYDISYGVPVMIAGYSEHYSKLIRDTQLPYRTTCAALANPVIKMEREYIRSHVPKGLQPIVDFGCQDGYQSVHLNLEKGYTVGVDIVFDFALEAYNKGCDTVNADAQYPPFRSGVFKVVYARKVLEHVRDLDRALDEWNRILQDGGLMVIVVPYNEPPASRIDPETGRVIVLNPNADDLSHLHYFNQINITEMLHKRMLWVKKLEVISEIEPNAEMLVVAIKYTKNPEKNIRGVKFNWMPY